MLPPEIEAEISEFAGMVKKFRAMEIPPEKFQRFRLQHGIYGQRQDGVQMVRIKIPLGMLNADQVECIADLAEHFAHNNAHITTRQDIQIHYVKLERVPELMKRLATVGLTTREACGNTVRNVTAAPSAGVDPEEAFDVTPYADAFAHHMLRNPICQNLGRKFKVAFDGGGVMTALPMLHDIGLIAQVHSLDNGWPEGNFWDRRGWTQPKSFPKGQDPVSVKGFKVYVGGGLGSSARIAKLMYDFLPVEELIPLSYAILCVFDRMGERKVRMKARMKFLIEKLGFEKFVELVEEERRHLKVLPEWNGYLKKVDEWEQRPPVVDESQIPPSPPLSKGGGGDFLAWKQTNVWPQRQKGYSMVEVRLTTGDMVPAQMRPLAGILRRYAGGKLRTMVHQNFLIHWVRDQDLPSLYEELKKIKMVKPDAQTLYDVTACPGTDTCRLGIASSMGLARVIEQRLYQEDGKIRGVARDLRIKISGCPNSCGQHHIANLGFYGGAIPVDGHTLPAFQMMLGGNFGREMELARPIGQVPSKNVPDVVVRLVTHFAAQKKGKESFNTFYNRMSKEAILDLLGDLAVPPSYETRPDFYTDWEGEGEFGLQKGVIGECAGAAVSAVVPQLSQADQILQQAEALQTHGDFASASFKAYEAVVSAANALLFHRLVETLNDRETTHEFENHFVRTGIFPGWEGFNEQMQTRRRNSRTGTVPEADAVDFIATATKFLKDCHAKEEQVARK